MDLHSTDIRKKRGQYSEKKFKKISEKKKLGEIEKFSKSKGRKNFEFFFDPQSISIWYLRRKSRPIFF